MAPEPLDALDASLKSAIHSLYTLQSSTHGYLGPETQSALVANASSLVTALQNISASARALPPDSAFFAPPGADATTTTSSSQAQQPPVFAQLPGEVVGYVDAARNPDVYTREFVELVQRGNAYLRGKGEALAGLRDALAEEIGAEWPEMKGVVAKVVEGRGEGIEPDELDKALGGDGTIADEIKSEEEKANGLKQEDVKMEQGP